MAEQFDVVVIGAGAAGMMCASVAGQRGRRVALVDHAEKLAEKIRISGGGRCNFTNLGTTHENFLSANPHFVRAVLSRYTPQDFLALLKNYGVSWHEKHKGQLFCDDSSQQIIDLLAQECARGAVHGYRPVKVMDVATEGVRWRVDTSAGTLLADAVVIATGGLSIPKIGASDFGHRLARKLGVPVVETAPALVPLTFDTAAWQAFADLAGVSLEVEVACGKGRFVEDLLFTHRGLSGPAILQISSYWSPGDRLDLNLAPGLPLAEELLAAKAGNRQHVANWLAQHLPRRLAEALTENAGLSARALAEAPDKALRQLAASATHWQLAPNGSEGYRKAEVTRGGVDTRALDQRSMAVRALPGLHFIGEVVDVTGWLGGYNFQWAWASGYVAGMVV